MASWKKIIVSGSDASLNTVTASSCFVGNLCGTATAATTVSTTDTTTNTDFNVTFTDGGGSGKILRVDTSNLAFNPSTNLLKIATGIVGCGGIEIGGTDGGATPITATLQYSPNGSGTGNVVVCLPESSGVLALTTSTVQNANCIGGTPAACVVFTCGNQTVAGVKTFSSCIVASGGLCGTASNAVTATSATTATTAGNSNCLGSAPQVCYVMTCGNQTVAGVKTFSSCIVASGGVCGVASSAVTATTAGNSNCLGGTPAACFVLTCGNQSISGDKTFNNNVIVSGDLTVNGTAVYVNTTNLAVEDKFILLNSGSNVAREGGLVIDEGSPSGSGHAFVYDADTNRWGFTASLSSTATSVVPDAFAAAVVTTDIAEYQKNGNIRIDTGTGDIFIYS